MFLEFYNDLSSHGVEIKKEIKNQRSWENAPYLGAFSVNMKARFSVFVPRTLGVYSVVMRINKDGEEPHDLPLGFSSLENGNDVYRIELDGRSLCGNDDSALLFYEILLLRSERTLFISSINNSDFELKYSSERKFSLLIYESDFSTPKWFGRGIMYHIFVDRFAKGEVKPTDREDIEINNDWENGIPQYAEYRGAPLKNNMFFGGNLAGICDKLEYIASLGTKVIYLSPVFKAYSNHKYDTGDYEIIDEMFGGEEAFKTLIKKAGKFGMKIILDGVFNHTGDDSKYFNRPGKYNSIGAYNSKQSPYYDWYTFTDFPDEYEAWWGIGVLPRLNQHNPDCSNYFVGDGGIIEKYTKMGIGGWRLDVADELPDEFLDKLRTKAHEVNKNALIIGEVWENAVTKEAYGYRRRYFSGRQLDSVMNYPLKNGIVEFVKNGDAQALYNALVELYSSYPKCVSNSLMNILGTHDTERILTVLGADDESYNLPHNELAVKRLNDGERAWAIRLLKIASVLQYTAFGIPSVFYGDEVGLEGYHDPFCRMPYPWGHENTELLDHYRMLGQIRLSEKVFDHGEFRVNMHTEHVIAYERYNKTDRICVCANRSDSYHILELAGEWTDLLTNEKFENEVVINPISARILKKI